MNKPAEINKEFIARLMAVQACYKMTRNKTPVRTVIEEYLESGLKTDEEPEEGQPSIPEELAAVKIRPHGGLFRKILLNLEERRTDIEEIVKAQTDTHAEVEPLLKSILLCGVCEILIQTKTDAPVIINDYLNVTYEFYPKSQVSFVNGILDSVAKLLREN